MTEANNRFIAEFMRLAKQDATNDGGEIYLYESPESGKYVYPEQLKYNQSWDWPMPVIKKINLRDYLEKGESLQEIMNSTLSDADIKATYKAVVKFIKWYNANI